MDEPWRPSDVDDEQIEALLELEQRLLRLTLGEAACERRVRYELLLHEVRERIREISLDANK